MEDEKKKDIDETIAEKNAEEKKDEAKRGGAVNRPHSEEKKGESIESITKDVPPNKEKVNLLDKAKNILKRKPTATTSEKGTDSERVPEKQNTESEAVKQSKVRNKDGAVREHAFDDDGLCVRCGVSKESATTHCFGKPLPRATAEKVKEGLVDYHNGVWKMRKPKDEDAGEEEFEPDEEENFKEDADEGDRDGEDKEDTDTDEEEEKQD
jgi:hypothetical protein